MSIDIAEVNKVLSTLHGAGYSLGVVGGFPRDLAHSKLPRDVDIVVLGGAAASLHVAELLYTEHDESDLEPSGEAGDFVGRIAACFKLACGADVIVADEKYSSVVQFVEDFDANINKYIMSPEGLPEFVGTHEGTLVLNTMRAHSITQDRVAYLRVKAALLGWRVLHV